MKKNNLSGHNYQSNSITILYQSEKKAVVIIYRAKCTGGRRVNGKNCQHCGHWDSEKKARVPSSNQRLIWMTLPWRVIWVLEGRGYWTHCCSRLKTRDRSGWWGLVWAFWGEWNEGNFDDEYWRKGTNHESKYQNKILYLKMRKKKRKILLV